MLLAKFLDHIGHRFSYEPLKISRLDHHLTWVMFFSGGGGRGGTNRCHSAMVGGRGLKNHTHGPMVIGNVKSSIK